MKKRLNKRGSHVGVVLSFLIFITFLAFLYVTLEPAIKIQEGKKSTIDSLKIAIADNLSDNLLSINIVNKTPIGDCIEFERFNLTFVDPDNNSLINSRLLVKDGSGNILPSKISGGNLFINRSNTGADFFKILMSEEFAEAEQGTMNGCTMLEKGVGYAVGSISSNEYIFESRVEKLKDLYDSGYDSLREYFSIPVGDEFGFGFEYANGTFIEVPSQEETKSKQSIYIDESPVQYVNKKGEVLIGKLRIKVW